MRLMTRDELLADDRSWTQSEWKAAYLALFDELQKQKAESLRLLAELAACKRLNQVKP